MGTKKGKKIKFKRDHSLKHGGRKHVPLPAGPFKVVACRDIMTGTKGKESGVLARLFYPAMDQARDIRDQYTFWPNWLPHENYRRGYADVAQLKRNSAIRFINWLVGSTFIPALKNGKPYVGNTEQDENDEGNEGPKSIHIATMPVIIFSHGLGGCRTINSALCLELASNGFFVAAIEHRDGTACTTFYPNEVTIPFHQSNPDLSLPTVDGISKASSINVNPSASLTIDTITEENETDSDNLSSVSTRGPRNGNYSSIIPKTTTEWIKFQDVPEDAKELYDLRNSQVKERAGEILKLLDVIDKLNKGSNVCNIIDGLLDPREFQGLLNTDRVTLMGHSMGATSALVAASLAPNRIFSLVAMDAWMYPIHKELNFQLPQPLLFVNTEKFAYSHRKRNLRAINSLLLGQEEKEVIRKIWTVKGAVHYNQTDLPFVFTYLTKVLFGGSSKRHPLTAHDLSASLILDFLCNQLQVHSNNFSLPEREYHLKKNKRKLKEGLGKKT